jgi:hypothetical protein
MIRRLLYRASGVEFVEAASYGFREHVKVREVRPVRPQADGQLIHVGEDADAQRQVAGERDDRERLEHLAAHQVERAAGPGDVRHHEVDQRLVMDEPADSGDERLGQVFGEVQERAGELPFPGVPGPAHQVVGGPESFERFHRFQGERHDHAGDAVPEDVVLILGT